MVRIIVRMSYGNWKKRHVGVSNDTGVIGRRDEGINGSRSVDCFLDLDLDMKCFLIQPLNLVIFRW